MYLDKSGNLTQTNANGGNIAATWDNLVANTDRTDATATNHTAVAAKITVGTTVIETVGGNDDVNGGAGTATSAVNITGAKVSADQMAKSVKGQDFSVTNGAGAIYAVTGSTGAVTFDADGAGAGAAVAAYTDNDGKLTTTDKETLQYFAHANGAVTNGTGSSIYKTEAGKLTTEGKTTSESTKDPLEALDKALAKVDALRSDLGAVQNRFDSTITNLGNTLGNLTSARSRIEDADYATEVSNMSRAQILQQAGTSVLAQANQVPQGVLSLLR
ncbi:Flagellin [compost metagenome]